MAGGGHGGIKIDAVNGTLTKPTNQTEIDFLNSIHNVTGEGGAVRSTPYALQEGYAQLRGIVPDYYGAGFSAETGKTITIGLIGHGLSGSRLMDVKVGSATVSKKELLVSGSKGAKGAWFKKRKLQLTDWYLNSSTRGYRIIHYTDGAGAGPASRSKAARADPSASFGKFFGSAKIRSIAKDNLIKRMIPQIKATPNVFFIAASVLFCMSDGDSTLRIRLIDFGHSYRISPPGMNGAKYRTKFIEGLESLAATI